MGVGLPRIEGDAGAYPHHATSSIRSQTHYTPPIQIIMDEISEDRANPTSWVHTTHTYPAKDKQTEYIKKNSKRNRTKTKPSKREART